VSGAVFFPAVNDSTPYYEGCGDAFNEATSLCEEEYKWSDLLTADMQTEMNGNYFEVFKVTKEAGDGGLSCDKIPTFFKDWDDVRLDHPARNKRLAEPMYGGGRNTTACRMQACAGTYWHEDGTLKAYEKGCEDGVDTPNLRDYTVDNQCASCDVDFYLNFTEHKCRQTRTCSDSQYMSQNYTHGTATTTPGGSDRTCADCTEIANRRQNTTITCTSASDSQVLTDFTKKCPDGFYHSSANAADTCTACDVGYYCENDVKKACNSSVGEYNSLSNQQSCATTTMGGYQAADENGACGVDKIGKKLTLCEEYTFHGPDTQACCRVADAGKETVNAGGYTTSFAASNQKNCTLGKWNNASLSNCKSIPDGYEGQDDDGTVVLSGAAQIAPCTGGNYAFQYQCMSVPVGKQAQTQPQISLELQGANITLTGIPAAWAGSAKPSSSAIDCQRGYYGLGGNAPCAMCDVHTANGYGHDSTGGTFTNQTGQGQCYNTTECDTTQYEAKVPSIARDRQCVSASITQEVVVEWSDVQMQQPSESAVDLCRDICGKNFIFGRCWWEQKSSGKKGCLDLDVIAASHQCDSLKLREVLGGEELDDFVPHWCP
jgi:hypothetical protein